MSLPKNSLDFLKSFVETAQANPDVLHHEELAFFKEYLLSMGATIPLLTEKKKVPATAPSAETKTQTTVEEEGGEEEEWVEVEENDPGMVAPDSAPFPNLPTFGVEGDWEKAGDFKNKGSAAAKAGEWNKAVEMYTKCLECQASGLTLVRRASALLECTPPRPNAAVNDCNCALKQNPDSAKAMKVRGKAYRLLGEYVKAASDLRKAQGYDFDPSTQELLKEVEQFAFKIEAKLNAKRIALEEKEKEEKLAARKAAAAERHRQQEEHAEAERQKSQQHGHGHGGHGHSHGGAPCDGNHGADSGMPGGMPGGMPDMPGMPAGMDMGAMYVKCCFSLILVYWICYSEFI